MKSILTLIVCMTILTISYGQQSQETENDKREYNSISSYDRDTEEWSTWKQTEEVFVLNYNDKGDIARFRPSEEMILYSKIANVPVEKGETSEGEKYQIISAREGFLKYEFQFFDDESLGLILKTGTIRLRFTKN